MILVTINIATIFGGFGYQLGVFKWTAFKRGGTYNNIYTVGLRCFDGKKVLTLGLKASVTKRDLNIVRWLLSLPFVGQLPSILPIDLNWT